MPDDSFKIGFVTAELFPVTAGGAGVFQYRAAEELLRRGHEVHVLLDGPRALKQRFLRCPEGQVLSGSGLFCLWNVEELLGSTRPPRSSDASWYQRKALQWFQAARALLRRVTLDVLEFPDFYGFGCAAISAHRWAGHAPGTRFAVRTHLAMEVLQSQEIGCYVDRDALLMHEQERVSMVLADAVLCPSRSYRAWIIEQYGLRGEQVRVSPLPVCEGSARAGGARPDTVLFLGRLFHFKGADRFVDGAVRLLESCPDLEDDIRFVLVGYDSRMGPGLTSFEAYLRRRIPPRLADRFIFTGQVPTDELGAWFARSLCYVCPSRHESFAYSVHEAAGAGVPLILSDLDAFHDYFQDSVNCMTFDGTAADLAAKLAMLLRTPALRQRLANAPYRPPAPLADAYEGMAGHARRAREAARPAVECERGRDVVAVVLDDGGPPAGGRAAAAIGAALPEARVVRVRPATSTSQRTVPFLGRLWEVAEEPLTGRVLLVCLSRDRIAGAFLRRAARMLKRRRSLGFVSPAAREADGRRNGMPPPLEIELPLWPFERGQALTRSLIRTEPGLWLGDLFDRRLDAYGEIAFLWDLIDAGLRGYQWPAPCADLAESDLRLDEPAMLQSMLLRNRNPRRQALLSRLTAQLIGGTTRPLAPTEPQRRSAAARWMRRLFHRRGAGR
jgi:glycosyltransferase involved in cell wall biosynthesis